MKAMHPVKNSASQPSETGAALITTTTYLPGARKQVVDPKGNTTTTTYQVFDLSQ